MGGALPPSGHCFPECGQAGLGPGLLRAPQPRLWQVSPILLCQPSLAEFVIGSFPPQNFLGPLSWFLRILILLSLSSSLPLMGWSGRSGVCVCVCVCVFKDFIYLFFERGREGETERNINMRLPLFRPGPGTRPVTQARALTRNQTWFTGWHSIH